MSGGWRIGQCRSFYSGATWAHASRPHPEAPGQVQEIAAPDREVLGRALLVHSQLDRLREEYGRDWLILADDVVPDGIVRWVGAQPREHGRPAPRTVPTPEELEQRLAAEEARAAGAPAP